MPQKSAPKYQDITKKNSEAMKRPITKIILATACFAVLPAQLFAQDNASGYFVDEYTYRYQMNPAMANERNFVAIPGIGNVDVDMRGNLSLTDVVYYVDGRTTLFLNPGVPASKVMNSLSRNNITSADVRVNILAAGFKAFKGYNTITIAARATVDAKVPATIFKFLKEGAENRAYDITGVRARGLGYGDIALNHSHAIGGEWRVGVTVHGLVGIAGADANLRKAHLELGEDCWTTTTDAVINTSMKGVDYKMKTNKHTGREYVNGLQNSFSAPNGWGLAFDLGLEYAPKNAPDWKFSLSVTDLGFIRWSRNLTATTGEQSFETDDFTFNVDGQAPNSFSSEWKRLRNNLETLYQLGYDGTTNSRTSILHATLRAGAEWTVPAYRKLGLGLLNTTRIAGPMTWTEFRLSGNIAPVKVFSAGVNLAVGSYGASFGWLLNLHCTGYNFFVGMDNTFAKIAKQGVPLASNASASVGMNVLF